MNKIVLVVSGMFYLTSVRAQQTPQHHHFGVQIPIWFNTRASFHASRLKYPGPDDSNPATDRYYDDGYSRVDSTGNMISPDKPAKYSFPRTSYFGYHNQSQVNNDKNPADGEALDPQGGSLSLSSRNIAGGDYGRHLGNTPFPGIELFYRYDWLERKRWSLNFETGLAWQHFNWAQSGNINALVDVITDLYSLGGVALNPPATPYQGIYDNNVPGVPVIGSTPTRTLSYETASVTGRRELEMDALLLRLGPALDWNVTHRFQVGLLAGLVVGWANTELSYNDEISMTRPTLWQDSQSGSSHDSHAWYGLYTALRAKYQISRKWDALAEVRHHWQDNIIHSAPTRSAEISFSDSMAVTIGVSRRF